MVVLFVAASVASPQPTTWKTTIQPLPGENLQSACLFEFALPAPASPVRAVWITYDRGYDITRYYRDPDVVSFARRHRVALMLARQCPAKDPPTGERGEMDMDVSRGVARSIFAALGDFARQSRHPEVASAKLIVLGFSGIGALFAHFVAYAPDRVLAAILANPGQSDPFGMDRINLSGVALSVPEFVIAGGLDDRPGTQRPYEYVRRHLLQGAPWVFVVQNGIPHCCAINVKPLMLAWLDEMLRLQTQGGLDRKRIKDAWIGSIQPCPTDRRDHWGEPLWDVCDASIHPARSATQAGEQPSAWFPNHRLAMDWLAFIRQKNHPADSFPDGLDAAHSEFAIHK